MQLLWLAAVLAAVKVELFAISIHPSLTFKGNSLSPDLPVHSKYSCSAWRNLLSQPRDSLQWVLGLPWAFSRGYIPWILPKRGSRRHLKEKSNLQWASVDVEEQRLHSKERPATMQSKLNSVSHPYDQGSACSLIVSGSVYYATLFKKIKIYLLVRNPKPAYPTFFYWFLVKTRYYLVIMLTR